MSWLTRNPKKDATMDQVEEKLRRIQADAQIINNPILSQGVIGVQQNAAYNAYNAATQMPTYEHMILMRLNNNPMGARGYGSGLDFMAAHKLTDEKIVVFVCNDGKYVTLEDDADLFPSDALVTQIRMLRK